MAITFGLPIVLLWLILGLLPVRNPSARRLWIGIYIGISVLVLLIAYLYCQDRAPDPWSESSDGEAQYWPLMIAAVVVGPGLLAAIVRLVASRPDPTPEPPAVIYAQPQYGQQYPPQQHQPPQYPYPAPYDPHQYPPPTYQPPHLPSADQSAPNPPPQSPPATPPAPPSSPPTV
ncbi:hypothetical protein ACFV8T_08715 [Streptomyces sp. NPDC059832]|uniref:hypothetical protein n=1 Tax=Streptomyces sp. NPDC059832 TaxID=3346966 RepID=UPI0036468CED